MKTIHLHLPPPPEAKAVAFRPAAAFQPVVPVPEGRISGVTGVILAGGGSSRMGRNKALLPCRGAHFIETIYRQVTALFDEVLLVTDTPEQYAFLECRKVPDIYPGLGALAGIHSGLCHSLTPHIFVVACDMPSLNEGLARFLAAGAAGADVVIPEGDKGLEPLHAIYGREARVAIEESLDVGRLRIVSFFDRVRVSKVTRGEVARFDPTFSAFRNINTPEDYFRFLRETRNSADNAPRQDKAGSGGVVDIPPGKQRACP